MNKVIKNFFDLDTWQEGRKLTKLIYQETKKFPQEEKFGLTSQMRRASVSVIANIAEGFGRISIKEKLNFYNQAHGSLTETQSHIFIAHDLGYITSNESKKMMAEAFKVQSMLQGLMSSTRKRL